MKNPHRAANPVALPRRLVGFVDIVPRALAGGLPVRVARLVDEHILTRPTRDGSSAHLLFLRDYNLMSQPVDRDSLEPAGVAFAWRIGWRTSGIPSRAESVGCSL